jgi:hypothetical protein
MVMLRRFCVQRLKVLIAVMLTRERRAATDDGCTALAALPPRPLEMAADAVAAFGAADV